ncbi:hypothetical protein C2I19_01310 [Chromobacterium alticapitis]|uniref:DUF2589 domain-containing protein n=2 Tax=Chromobacterium alticapitis TaxID=2073169 RepID=A0A2S5DLB3_9NEIS|nr:hypothetical protein C2I19_01310 [Chromobacterium alticapitis]
MRTAGAAAGTGLGPAAAPRRPRLPLLRIMRLLRRLPAEPVAAALSGGRAAARAIAARHGRRPGRLAHHRPGRPAAPWQDAPASRGCAARSAQPAAPRLSPGQSDRLALPRPSAKGDTEMTASLGALISGLKKAVIEAQRSVSHQHIEELRQFFVPDREQDPSLTFPEGAWTARMVGMNVPREVSRNGAVALEHHEVQVPLITLLPLKSFAIEKVEVLTTLNLALAETPDGEEDEEAAEVRVSLRRQDEQTAELKIVIQALEPPAGYQRVVAAYEKLLNAQLPV